MTCILFHLDKTYQFHIKLNERHEFARGPLWGLVDTAKELAFHRAHPEGYVQTTAKTDKDNDNKVVKSGDKLAKGEQRHHKQIQQSQKRLKKVTILES